MLVLPHSFVVFKVTERESHVSAVIMVRINHHMSLDEPSYLDLSENLLFLGRDH